MSTTEPTLYCTRWALTRGIIEIPPGTGRTESYVRLHKDGEGHATVSRQFCHTSRAEAVHRVEAIRADAIDHLTKQLGGTVTC